MSPQTEGRVLSAINNIYLVETGADARRLLCTIKGKKLAVAERMHNPIAVGDRVRVQETDEGEGRGILLEVLSRSSVLQRWNKKTRAPQLLAVNARLLVCMGSTRMPPFRPRFLDRLLIAGESGGMEILLLLNKSDLGVSEDVQEREEVYRGLGYRVLRCSAASGEGLEELRERLRSGPAVLAGQSGVGKTSILNRLEPGLQLKVAEISTKYDRGVHTTTAALMLRLDGGIEVIDTPGMREFELTGIEPAELRHFFPEFETPARACEYSGCLHMDEERCGVQEAAASGAINEDRYVSYVRTYQQLLEAQKSAYG